MTFQAVRVTAKTRLTDLREQYFGNVAVRGALVDQPDAQYGRHLHDMCHIELGRRRRQ